MRYSPNTVQIRSERGVKDRTRGYGLTSGQATWARVEGTTLPDLIFNDEAEATIKSLSLPYCVSLDKFAAMNGSIVTPTVSKPSDRAWWKSASVYQSEPCLR